MRTKTAAIVSAVVFALLLSAPAWAQSGTGPPDSDTRGQMNNEEMMQSQLRGKMHQRPFRGMSGGCPMAMGGDECPMSENGRCPGLRRGEWMGAFHSWLKNFMIHSELFNLSDQQKQQFESGFAENYRRAVKTRADLNLMKVDLVQTLREEPIKLEAARDIMEKIASGRVDLKMNFLEFYSSIMENLDPDQRERVKEVLGSPFPMPWEGVAGSGEMEDDGQSEKDSQ